DHRHSAGRKRETSLLPEFLHPAGAENPSRVLLPADSSSPAAFVFSRVCRTELCLPRERHQSLRRRVRLWAAVVAGGGRALLHFLARGCPQTYIAAPRGCFAGHRNICAGTASRL